MKSCREWEELAKNHLVESLSPSSGAASAGLPDPMPRHHSLRAELARHLQHCVRCQQEYGQLFGVDASLQAAFQTLGGLLADPSAEQTHHAWEAIQQPSETSRLLKKTRRLTSTLLWITVFVFSTIGLLALARYVYWLQQHGKGG